jgi:hypothetical protein
MYGYRFFYWDKVLQIQMFTLYIHLKLLLGGLAQWLKSSSYDKWTIRIVTFHTVILMCIVYFLHEAVYDSHAKAIIIQVLGVKLALGIMIPCIIIVRNFNMKNYVVLGLSNCYNWISIKLPNIRKRNKVENVNV